MMPARQIYQKLRRSIPKRIEDRGFADGQKKVKNEASVLKITSCSYMLRFPQRKAPDNAGKEEE